MGGSGSGPRRKSNAKDTRNHHGPLGRGLKTNPPAGIPDCPFQLSKSARKHWDRLVPILSMLKTLTLVDGPALAAYCLAADRSDQADARIEKYGIIVDGKQNPAIAVRSAAQREMHVFQSNFGLTPLSRARLGIHIDDATDREVDAFLSGSNTDKETIQ